MRFNKLYIILSIIVALVVSPMSHAYQYLYVVSLNGGSFPYLSKIDALTNTPLSYTQITTGSSSPRGLVITPTFTYAYVADSANNCVWAINLSTNVVTKIPTGASTAPVNLAISGDGNYVYSCNVGTASVTLISTASNTALGTFSTPGITAPYCITISGTTGYVGDSASSNAVQFNIAVGGAPSFGTAFPVGTFTSFGLLSLAINPAATTLYVVNYDNDMVYPVALPSNVVGSGIALLTSNPSGIAITANGQTAYVTDSSVATMNAINLNTNVVSSFSVAGRGFYCAVSPDGSTLYAPSTGSNTVSVINTTTDLPVAGTPITLAHSNGEGVAITTHIPGGTLDTTFGNGGFTLTPISRSDTLRGAVIQTGDKIIITGTTQTTAPSLFLAQYTSSGILDTGAFNTSGTPGYYILLPSTISSSTTSCAGNAVALDASNNILVAGYADQSQNNMLLARFTTAGVLDTTFNSTGYLTQSIGTGAQANGVGVQAIGGNSGKIVIAGTSINNGSPNFTLARFSASGSLDATFGTSGITQTAIGHIAVLNAMVVDSSDNIVVAGITDNQVVIARYTSAGLLDGSFGSGGIFIPPISNATSSKAYSVTLDASGNIIVAGSAIISGLNESLLMRVTTAGVLDTSFNTTGYILQSISYGSEFYSAVVQTTGYIVAGGYAIAGLATQISMAQYTSAGALNTGDFGTNGISLTTIGSVAAAKFVGVQSTQEIIAAGTADGCFYVARFIG